MTDEHTDLPDCPGRRRPRQRVPTAASSSPTSRSPTPACPSTWRPTDVDPAAEKRAERQVATLFGLSAVCAVLFVVAYVAFEVNGGADGAEVADDLGLGASNVALGASLGGALLLIGIGLIQWARKLMGDHEIVEMRHPARSSDEDREETLRVLALGAEESGIARRPWSATRCSVRSASSSRPSSCCSRTSARPTPR